MIHVEGHDVKVGAASGKQLIDEASRAVIGVIKSLAHQAPQEITEEMITKYVLHRIGHDVANASTVFKECIKTDDGESYDDFMNRLFGDLFD